MECLSSILFCYENRARDAPEKRQDTLGCPKTSPKPPQDAPVRGQHKPKSRPRGAQDGSKAARELPKKRPKGAQERLKSRPRPAQEPPRPDPGLDLGSFRQRF